MTKDEYEAAVKEANKLMKLTSANITEEQFHKLVDLATRLDQYEAENWLTMPDAVLH